MTKRKTIDLAGTVHGAAQPSTARQTQATTSTSTSRPGRSRSRQGKRGILIHVECTAPLDVWVHGLVGMEERPGTCASDGILFELAGTLYEREYGPSVHSALVARLQGTVATTMETALVRARRKGVRERSGLRGVEPDGDGRRLRLRSAGQPRRAHPLAGLALGEAGDRTVRAGTRWQFGPDAVLSLEATRQTSDAGEAANQLMLRAALRF